MVITRSVSFSQSVGIGTTTPDASSVLELKATNKGFLPPRMTAAEKALIASPKAGLIIYQTDGVTGLYVYNGSAWEAVAGGTTGSGWALNGNSGTNPSSSFIGTIDNQPLKFRINNMPAGELNPINFNIGFGKTTLESNTTGTQNTAIGGNSLNHNTTGQDNVGVGIGSLFSNTSGDGNVGIGLAALVFNKTGNNNVGVGAHVLYNNQQGYSNVAVGISSSFSNIVGNNIVAIGDSALYNNTASFNMAIGSKALFANTTGVSNTALGSQSLYNNLTGNQNTAVGRIALYANTTGIQNTALGNQAARYNQTGNANTAIGFQSLLFNVANSNNTAVGNGSLANTISDNNTAVGHSALNDNTIGVSNTAVGFEALASNVNGNYNTAIGYKAAIYGSNYVNATAVGANAQSGCSNCVVLGSTNGYNGATADTKVGIGLINPQKTLHVNPNGAGGIAVGNNLTTGGYTILNMGISQESGGYGFIQGIKSSGTAYGDLVLNQSGGNVGIRTSSPFAPLHIKQASDPAIFNTGGIRIETAGNSYRWDMGIDNTLDFNFSFNGVPKLFFEETDGEITIVSDIRAKKDIQSIKAALPSIMKLQAKSYHYKDNAPGSRLSYGFIAQDVEKIFPDFVTTKGEGQLKAVGYQKLNVMAIKAIQEQQVMIELLEQQLIDNAAENKRQNAKQQSEIESLQAQMKTMLETMAEFKK